MSTIPIITPQQVAEFATTHEFNERGYSNWFRLVSESNGSFVDPSREFVARRFDLIDIASIAIGLNEHYRARPVQ